MQATEEQLGILTKLYNGNITDNQATFLLSSTGLSLEESDKMIEEYGVYYNSAKTVVKILSVIILCFLLSFAFCSCFLLYLILK
jgi:hypothetical protein